MANCYEFMVLGLFALLLPSVICENLGANDPKIVGGTAANLTEVYYQASIQFSSSSGEFHFCGGVVIKKDTILTAAHCTFDGKNKKLKASDLIVYWNTTNTFDKTRPKSKVKKIIAHKKYNSNTMENDIAVLKLYTDVKASKFISLRTNDTKTGENCTISGWGDIATGGPTSLTTLRRATVPIYSFALCKQIYKPLVITDSMICAGGNGKDSCQGDSGGPMVCGGKLAGIVSFGYKCADIAPGVYTQVSKYEKWIKENSATVPTGSMALMLTLLSLIINHIR